MTTDVRVVHDVPAFMAGLIAQEVGALATIACPTCDGEGVAYAHSTSGRKTDCHECWGAKTVQVPASEIEPQTERCRLCRGRTQLETAEGFDVTCWQCEGTGDQPRPETPATCTRCSGRQSWQLHDGAVEECPACTGDDTSTSTHPRTDRQETTR